MNLSLKKIQLTYLILDKNRLGGIKGESVPVVVSPQKDQRFIQGANECVELVI